MIRIKRIYSSTLPADREHIEEVKEIFRQNFPGVSWYAEKISDMLDHPFKYGYSAVLLVSLSAGRRVTGFSLVLHFHQIKSSYLDFIAARHEIKGSGLGSALYEASREMARARSWSSRCWLMSSRMIRKSGRKGRKTGFRCSGRSMTSMSWSLPVQPLSL